MCVIMCASELDTHCGVIFSVNSLGQQSHWRLREAVCAWPHTPTAHLPLQRPKQQSGSKYGPKICSSKCHTSLQSPSNVKLESIRLKISLISLTGGAEMPYYAQYLGPPNSVGIWLEHFGSS